MLRTLFLVATLLLSTTIVAEAGKGGHKVLLADDVFVTPNPAAASSPINIDANHLKSNWYHMVAYCGVGLLIFSDSAGEVHVESYSCSITDDLVVLEYDGGVSTSYHEVGRVTVVIR